jgi:hypothetical protein
MILETDHQWVKPGIFEAERVYFAFAVILQHDNSPR